MIVSWNWLKQYVRLDMPVEELTGRLMMAGLNHEGTEEVGGDLAIDLEVTSNRPDCLGHLGVAREVGVLFGREVTFPPASLVEGQTPVERLAQVRIECPDLCPRYTARVIRGVRVGPSPGWMARRLKTLGLVPINNIVDISNYVLMECGQPLHTFDYARLKGPEIVVRRPKPGEQIEAIDHNAYRLEPEMCVICDAEDPVAIGGVMGGATTEISEATTDVLIEAAEFDPVSIRNTARTLRLHSDSSYRFERVVDSEFVDWASRRCCGLILELAGGELAQGVIDMGRRPAPREPIVLRLRQIERVLGIEIPEERLREILLALGNEESPASLGADASGDRAAIAVVPPSWRRDLGREIDLIEEVGRVHGYDQIPEDVSVPMAASSRTPEDRVLEKVRTALVAFGLDEAMTLSVVDEKSAECFLPWTEAEPLRTRTPIVRGADVVRKSLLPSLLGARKTNESAANDRIELFEVAKVYWPRGKKLPVEERMIGIASGRPYAEVKGFVESLPDVLHIGASLESTDADCDLLDPAASCRLLLDGKLLGFVGRAAPSLLEHRGLRQPTAVAEVRLGLLVEAAELVPQFVPVIAFPAVARDINLVVDDEVRWAHVATTARKAGGACFEELRYLDTYRDPQRLGEGKKSLLFSVVLRSKEGTLTSQEADAVRDGIVAACQKEHGAQLRA